MFRLILPASPSRFVDRLLTSTSTSHRVRVRSSFKTSLKELTRAQSPLSVPFIARFSIWRQTTNVRLKFRISQSRKRADNNSLKQLLWMKTTWNFFFVRVKFFLQYFGWPYQPSSGLQMLLNGGLGHEVQESWPYLSNAKCSETVVGLDLMLVLLKTNLFQAFR